MHIIETSYYSENGVRFAFNDKVTCYRMFDELNARMDTDGYIIFRDAIDILPNCKHMHNVDGILVYGWTCLDHMNIKRITTSHGHEWQLSLPKVIPLPRECMERPKESVSNYYVRDDKVTEELLDKLDETTKMNSTIFNKLLDELDDNSLETLKKKNANYSQDDDKLHNFRKGAEFTGETVAQTCWGYMSKHLVSLQDKVLRNDFSDREDFLEKCQDTINYIRFLWCIGNEENEKKK